MTGLASVKVRGNLVSSTPSTRRSGVPSAGAPTWSRNAESGARSFFFARIPREYRTPRLRTRQFEETAGQRKGDRRDGRPDSTAPPHYTTTATCTYYTYVLTRGQVRVVPTHAGSAGGDIS